MSVPLSSEVTSSAKGIAARHRPNPVSGAPPSIPDHELLRRIGSGSYGDVWLARNILGTYRAVKIVLRNRFENDRPFEREFEGIKKFEPISRSHESQVNILQVGQGDGYFYYVMELADDGSGETADPESEHEQGEPEVTEIGTSQRLLFPPVQGGCEAFMGSWKRYAPRTLKSELQRHGRIRFEECLRIALSLTNALAHLHKHGLVHRDIKPSNIVFIRGVPKLADIGLVTDLDATMSFVGTEGFLPPEGRGSVQADIYSLGKVLYEMVTGKDRLDFPEPPTNLAESAERDSFVELNEVILKACASDPRQRYQTTEEMHSELALLQAGKSVRRVRGMENRVRQLSRWGVAAVCIISVVSAGWIYQQRQTREARYWAEQSRQQLARSHTAEGIKRIEEGNPLTALPLLVEALKLDNGSSREETHRLRLGILLSQAPALTGFWQTPEVVDFVDLSPDHRAILAVHGRTLKVWEFDSARLRSAGLEHAGNVLCAVFSPQSDRIATATDRGEAIVWDANTGTRVFAVTNLESTLKFIAFSPDGKQVATAGHLNGSGQGMTQVWDVESGNALHRQMEYDGTIVQLVFGPSGRHLATLSNSAFGSQVKLWDASSGRLAAEPFVAAALFPMVQFSPDGAELCIVNGGVTVLDIATGRLRMLPYVEGATQLISFMHDGKWLAVSAGQSVRVHRFPSGQPVGSYIHTQKPVRSIQFSPDNRTLLTTSDDFVVRVWDIHQGLMVRSPLPHESQLRRAVFSEAGRVVIGISGQTVRRWDFSLAGGIVRDFINSQSGILAGLAPDGQHLVAATASIGRVYDAWTGATIGRPLAHNDRITAVDFSSNGRLFATGSLDQTAQIWDLTTARPIGPRLVHSASVDHVLFHPNGARILTTSGTQVRLWDTASGQPLGPVLELPSRVAALAWNADECILACESKANRSEVFTVAMTSQLSVINSKTWPGRIVGCFTSFNRVLLAITPDESTVRIWDNASGLAVTPPLHHPDRVNHFAASADGTKAVTSCLKVRLWDLRSGELIALLNEYPDTQYGRISFDNRHLVTASDYVRFRIWSLAPEPRSIEDVQRMASMLSAQEYDSTGVAMSLGPVRAGEIWARLQSTSEFPTSSPALAAAWHRREAAECEGIGSRSAEALFHREMATQWEPGVADDLMRRAIAYARTKNWESAKRDYHAARALGAEIDDTSTENILLKLLGGDIDGYRKSCRDLLAEVSGTEQVGTANETVWLSCLLPNALDHYDLPVTLMRKAAQRAPLRNNILNTLGAVLFRAGAYQEAVETLHQAAALASGEGTVFDSIFLAMAHQRLGDSAKARHFLDKAIRQFAPDPARLWRWELELDLLRKEAEELVNR